MDKEEMGFGFSRRMLLALWYRSNFTLDPDKLKWVGVKTIVNDAAVKSRQQFKNTHKYAGHNALIRKHRVHGLISVKGKGRHGNNRKCKLTKSGLYYLLKNANSILDLGLNNYNIREYEKNIILRNIQAARERGSLL